MAARDTRRRDKFQRGKNKRNQKNSSQRNGNELDQVWQDTVAYCKEHYGLHI